MTAVADLVRAMHDIDVIKGRTCGVCLFRKRLQAGGLGCHRGHDPVALDDGCDDWMPRKAAGEPDMATAVRVAATPHGCTQRALDEPDRPEAC